METLARPTGTPNRAPEVFSLREVSRAAGVAFADVRALAGAGAMRLLPSGFVAEAEAIRAVRMLRGSPAGIAGPQLFWHAPGARPNTKVPLVASGAVHVAGLFAIAIVTTTGIAQPAPSEPAEFKPVRLVFLATPGAGGGGGGGGLKLPAPAVQARLRGPGRLRSPVQPPAVKSEQPRTEPPRPSRPPDPTPVARPTPEPPRLPHPDPAPPVMAPVVPIAADPIDRAGVLDEAAPENGSRGAGAGGGSGTGTGTGTGEGDGAGLGPGSGGGTGGGPYRPGAGITPPGLLREVRPDYTDEARRRNIEGEVVLEIVVRRDGSVGDTRVVRGLGGGLERRALDAVRQWRFSPARRRGTPVDVLVEVAVEFRLR